MSVPVYSNISTAVTVALRDGSRSHNPQQSAAIAPAPSNHPILARTANKRRRLTGRERVNNMEPWRPLFARKEDCVATPAPARMAQIIVTRDGIDTMSAPKTATSELTDAVVRTEN